MHPFTLAFLLALAAATLFRLWLNARQIRHVRAHRDRLPEAFADSVSLAEHRKAADYTVAKAELNYAHIALDALLILGFTLGGGVEWLQAAALGLLPSSLWAGTLLVFSVMALYSLAELPLSVYRTFGIEARFGFNRMGPALFIADLLKQIMLSVILGLPLIALALWLIQAAGSYWWLYAWLAWSAFNLVLLIIFPTLIAPLFNRFAPLQDVQLKARVEALLQKCGFEAKGVFVMDGSRRSSHGNAYFTGLGKTKRVVFFDTLLKSLDAEETEAVLAHELGHHKLRHIPKRVGLSFALSLAGLALLAWLMEQTWFYEGLHVYTPSPAAAFALFFLVLPVFGLPLRPVASLYSRKHEFEADRYAADQTDATHLIQALTKLYRDNAATLTPDPLHSAVYESHPPSSVRIARLKVLAHN
jgi:STE24 endopeptidase